MATDVTIGGEGTLFVGEDKTFRLELLDTDDPVKIAADLAVPVDMSGWVVFLDIRKKDNSADPPILQKTATISGTYNVSRSSNAQRAVVTLTDTEMNLFKGSNIPAPAGLTYRHSWKRMDDGSETVLARGDWTPEKATAP